MSSLYWFSYREESVGFFLRTMIAFCGHNDFNIYDLKEAITQATSNDLPPDRLFIFIREAAFSKEAASLTAQHSAFLPIADHGGVTLLKYDTAGSITGHICVRGAVAPPSKDDLDAIRRRGLTHLFRIRGGMLDAGPTAYFVKPSKNMSRQFLRAAQVLAEGAEVYFVAFWILPYMGPELRCIHMDTSAIGGVIFAALLLQGRQKESPAIRTFRSYQGLEAHPFSVDQGELVVISASQSGGMAERVTKRLRGQNKVVTLFHLATNSDKLPVLCDLSFDADKNPDGFKPPEPVDFVDERSSRPLRIVGEQFAIEPVPPIAVVPGHDHSPVDTMKMLQKLGGKRIFRCARWGLRGKEVTPWVDGDALINTPVCQKWLNKKLASLLPASTRAIIYLKDDPGSLAMAEKVKVTLKALSGGYIDAQLFSSDQLTETPPDWGGHPLTVVIAGGAIGRGYSFLAVSRDLRTWAPDAHRVYLCALTVPPTRQALELLTSNLKYPEHRFERFAEICLPRDEAGESWKCERAFLNSIKGHERVPDVVALRIDELDATGTGLLDNLFWPGTGGPLKLRRSFAFWPEDSDCTTLSQADVYVAISALLENARSGKIKKGEALVSNAHRHAVISPETFSRYNDGVIQAAFLRAALPIELDYRDAPVLSGLLAELIGQAVEHHDRQGEASFEFLLALALRRVRLCPQDFSDLKTRLGKLNALPEPLGWFVKWLCGAEEVPTSSYLVNRPPAISGGIIAPTE